MKAPLLSHLDQKGNDVNIVDSNTLRFLCLITTLINHMDNLLSLLLAARNSKHTSLPLIFLLHAHNTIALQLQELLLQKK